MAKDKDDTLTLVAGFDFPGGKQGEVVDDPKFIVKYLRTVYEEANDAKTDLSDDQIMAIANATPLADDQDDWEALVCEAIESGNVPGEAEAGDYEIAEDIRAVSEKIAGDKAIQKWIDDVIQGQAKVDSGPVHIFERLVSDLTPQERAIIPWPGSKAEDGTNNPDVYEIRKQKTNGEWGSVKGYKVRDIIALQPRVVALDEAINSIKAPDGAKLSPIQLGERKDLNAERSSAVRAYTRAFKVMHIADKLMDHKHIGFAVKKDDKEQTTVSKYCLNLWNKHKNLDGGSFTVSAFINLKAITPDMTYPQLAAMMKRGKKPKQTTATRLEANDVEPTLSMLVNALETNGIWSIVATNITQDTDEARHLRLTLSAAERLVNDLLDKQGVRAKLKADREWEEKQGNDAKRNAA